MRRATIGIAALASGLTLATGAWAGSAAPLTAPVDTPIERGTSEPRVSLGPSRFDSSDAAAGDTLSYELRVRNTTTEVVRLRALALAIEGSPVPSEYARVGGRSARSQELLDWVSFPGFTQGRELAAGHELRIPVRVDVPADPPPGTFALGLSVAWSVAPIGVDTQSAPAGRVRLSPTLTSVAVITLPGTAVAEARLRSLASPRWVWGGARPTFRARVANVGDTELTIDGKVDLDAFVLTASRTLNAAGPEKGQPTLPGGVRDVKMRWSDPPLLGWFRPELVIVGGKGSDVRITKHLDTVYVLPPWWLVLIVAVAIWLPLRARRRRRGDPATQELRAERAKQNVEQRLARDRARQRAADARRGRR
ncbi:MAG: hypothetical protein JWL76_1868 [Thermoleophilia bacterium]|nr:hypothetical protein [Thermoleophilia bacterium]